MARKTTSKEQRAKSKEPVARSKTRKVKQPRYKSFRVSKRIKITNKPLTGSFRLLARSLRLLRQNWRLFGGIILIYLLLTVVLVKGFGVSNNIGELKETLADAFDGQSARLVTSAALFTVLLGTANSTPSEVAGAYQSILLIIMSLVFIWTLRQILADKEVKITIRDGFYKGMYPFIPFLLVLLVIGLQLVPLAIGNFLYATVIGGGLAVTALETGLWLILIFLFGLLSIYMVSSSIFALYIVTLPNVRPLTALRSARELVRYRRWLIMRKVVFLPIALLILAGVIIVPILMVSPAVAEWVFFVMSMSGLAIAHSFLYSLYRELL